MSIRLPELLAPAGSWDSMKAAVAAGADAVYLGGRRFGARASAENFTLAEMERAVEHAHLRGVKVYVTVNTLVHDRELAKLAEYMVDLYAMGVDALLIQDLGAISLAKEVVPGMELHGSTQMTIHNVEGAIRAASLGLRRVVLARELALPEVESMASAGIGLEIFVHGALCYCYSGQCLLSQAIGGRSGNRGVCAQPCRKPYRLLSGEADAYGRMNSGKAVSQTGRSYLLSPRDLSLYPHLEMIVRSQVEAIKIEGRMRSPLYVATVVDVYRRALDAIGEGEWSPSLKDMDDLALAFNRGFTAGYLMGERGEPLMATESPENRGLHLGRVSSVDGHGVASIEIHGTAIPEKGDGLVFIQGDCKVGLVLRRDPLVRGRQIWLDVPPSVERGAIVRMTRRASLERRIQEIMRRGRPPIPIRIEMTWDEGVPLARARIAGPKGDLLVSLEGERMEKARSSPLSNEQIRTQIERSGGTPFAVDLSMNYPGGLFAPPRTLNRLRRDLLEGAEIALIEAFKPSKEKVASSRSRLPEISAEPPFHRNAANHLAKTSMARLIEVPAELLCPGRSSSPTLAAYAESLETVEGAVRGGCTRIYFQPEDRIASSATSPVPPLELLERAVDAAGKGELVWKWPRITRRRFLDIAKPLLPKAFDAGISEVMVDGLGAASAVIEGEPRMSLSGSAGLNIWNFRSALLLKEFRRLTLSPELNAQDILETAARVKARGGPKLELVVQGSQEVMVSEDCLPCRAARTLSVRDSTLGLLDSTGRTFPLRLDTEGRTHIFNAVETSLVDAVPALLDMGIASIVIDARWRSPAYAERMAQIYRKAMAGDVMVAKGEVRSMAWGGITTGSLFR
ncbi:MAG: U32 family peptidase [Methanotrichaceae archaeon]|nr:U32 family peptidase [Methanotrichaceae archaeon]